MKKSIIFIVSLLVASVCSAQTLDEIVKKYYTANGIEVLEKASTLTMEGKMVQMGTEMPMTLTVKKPDKVRVVISFGGMEIVTTYDGEKGYMLNPLAGMDEPVEIPAEQLGSVQEYNMFRDNLLEAFKAGRMKLDGEAQVEGKAAWKVTITDEAGKSSTAFIDKSTYLTVKMVAKVEQMGQEMEVESYIREWLDVSGAKFAKVISQMVNGTELGRMTFDKIELNRNVEDSLFRIK